MKTTFKVNSLAAALCLVILGACGDDDSGATDEQAVIDNYAGMVYQGYSDSVTKAAALKTAIDAFVAAPSAALLTAARDAWLASREPYLQTEVYRFYNGPIDNETDGPEVLINSWPLDEAYIDYVTDSANAGIINDTADHPALSKEVIAGDNFVGGEEHVSAGYHAIEFLLWGQDHSASGPGDRPFTDYVTGAGGTAANQARRGQYLELVAEMLVDDLTRVRDAWAPSGTTYRSDFRGKGKTALGRMLTGMGELSRAELSGERMLAAYDNKDQEDEHSCFSDNTHRDLYNNALGIQNVYLGHYGATDGPGLDVLVKAIDPALDTKMQTQLAASLTLIQAIPVPFDQAILGEDTEPGRMKIHAAIRALQDEAETVAEIIDKLGAVVE